MSLRPSGERLKEVTAKVIEHTTQKDGYNCGVITVKASARYS